MDNPPTNKKDFIKWCEATRDDINKNPDYKKITLGDMYLNGFKHGMIYEQNKIQDDVKNKLNNLFGGDL